jgi:alkylation response protein AidB-like acyl-CoA dehydrogenase
MHGGYGYFEEYRIQRLYRDAKVIEMWGGGKEIDETMMSNALR